MLAQTEYGTVSSGPDGAEVSATHTQLYAWAHRPGAVWPCSELATFDLISAKFAANGDLVDLEAERAWRPAETDNLAGDELNAWTSDVLLAAGLENHPAIR